MAKGKKQRKAEDSDDEVLNEIHSDEEIAEPAKNAGKKGKKDRKKKKEAELEEAMMEQEALANNDLADLPPEEDVKPKKKKEKKKKKAESESEDDEPEPTAPTQVKKSGFAAFMMDDSDEDHAVDSDEAPVIIKAAPEPKKKNKKKTKTEEPKDEFGDDDDEKENKKKKKKKKKGGKADADEEEDELEKALAELNIEKKEDEGAKSAAQKKKEKKERQKQKQKEEELKGPSEAKDEVKEVKEDKDQEEPSEGKGKKKGKGKKEDEDTKKKGKKPNSAMLAAMQEALKIKKEEEEKARLAEEERIRKEEEAEAERLEKKRIEEEKKALKKQREKERKEQLRKEGKLLTAKQKADKARAEQMLAAMRAQGMEVPESGVKLGPRPGTRVRNKNKAKSQTPEAEDKAKEPEKVEPEPEPTPEPEPVAKEPEPEDDVLDSWDAESEDEDAKKAEAAEDKSEATKAESEDEESESESEESEDESDDESDESEEESEDEEEQIEDARERAIARIRKRKAENEAKRTTDDLRAPVVVVMGHVDTGKTKLLDKLRRTNVQDGEAGGITQQIGATNVPVEVVHEQCKMVTGYKSEKNKLPGFLIIDTPGHESFSNLRDRGSSLCDIAILVVDIMHGLEPQTIESINLLKKKEVPFVIALNKIDRLYEWKSNKHKDIRDVVNSQNHNSKLEFDKKAKEVVFKMAEQGLNVALYYENPDPKEYISMVPTSAHSGEGLGNLQALLVHLCQTQLAKRLSFSEELQANVMEVKAIPGLGTTIDIVLLNGTLKEGQTMIVAGTEGPIETTIKALLTPSKMQDLRVKNSWQEHKELRGACGVKIAAKELEKTVAGLNLLVANRKDEIEICKEEMERRLSSALNSIKVKDRGVFVQASTLGSLEALLSFLKDSKIPYAGVKIGPVVKKDVMKASVMLEHEPKYCVILAFDVKIERDAQELADKEGVTIFQADIIYHLQDSFVRHLEELKRRKREEYKTIAVFPCKFKILPNFVFNSRDPIVAGVQVEAGIIRQGTPICVPSKDFLEIGIVTSIQANHKEVETARKGEEVCVKIEPIPGESPKMFNRHFDEKDMLVSKISRASIDACKDYFREDLSKDDWKLMKDLKNVFCIL